MPIASLAHAALSAAAVGLLLTMLRTAGPPAAVLSMCAVVFGRAALPPVTGNVLPRRGRRRDGPLLSVATAAAMSLLVCELARHSGPHLCGLVAAIPLVGTFATVAGYRQGGTPLMLRVVGGYLDGMAAKAAFLA